MKTILDACAAIHLLNGRVLDTVLDLRSRRFLIGPIALDECGSDRLLLEGLLAGARIGQLDDDSVSATAYLTALETFGLGPGETECLVFAIGSEYHICTDDAAARKVATRELGAGRLTGSLGLIREAVAEKLLSPDAAWAAYQLMLSTGAYLPELPQDFFSS